MRHQLRFTPFLFLTILSVFTLRSSVSHAEGYPASTIRNFYLMDWIPNRGAGQTVAIIVNSAGPNVYEDLKVYSQANRLPLPTPQTFQNIKVGNLGAPLGTWPIEARIDTQMVHAMAPLAKILLIEIPEATSATVAAAIWYAMAYGASVVSMSFGEPEENVDDAWKFYLDSLFQTPGMTFIASTGDLGSNPSPVTGQPRVAFPASSPNVTAIGGTTVHPNDYVPAWPHSGGGRSNFFARPRWQDRIPLPGGQRMIPDLALDAAAKSGPAIYSSTKGWVVGSGTSVAAPLFAGMMAVANEIHGRPIGGINAKLYSIPNSVLYGIYGVRFGLVQDVVEGSNGNFFTHPGYDMVTGLGIPSIFLINYMGHYF